MDYRTEDGLAHYGFSLEPQPDGSWRVYIMFRPLSHHLDHDLQLPHQAVDSNGRSQINWPSKIENLGDAKTVAALWAELVHSYQRAGQIRAN